MIRFKEFINEKYKGSLSDFKREFENEIENLGYSPKVIKKISKKGKGFEVRVASYMKGAKEFKDIAIKLGASNFSFRPGGGVNIMMIEGKGLWHNIHKRRKSGKRMRKPGEKGAPTAQDFKNASKESYASEGKGSKPEPFEVGFKRRVVKTTKPEHK